MKRYAPTQEELDQLASLVLNDNTNISEEVRDTDFYQAARAAELSSLDDLDLTLLEVHQETLLLITRITEEIATSSPNIVNISSNDSDSGIEEEEGIYNLADNAPHSSDSGDNNAEENQDLQVAHQAPDFFSCLDSICSAIGNHPTIAMMIGLTMLLTGIVLTVDLEGYHTAYLGNHSEHYDKM